MTVLFHDSVGAQLLAILEEHGVDTDSTDAMVDWFRAHPEFLPEGQGPLEAMCRAKFQAVTKRVGMA